MKTTDIDQRPIFCEQCGSAMTLGEEGYSLRAFKKILCSGKCQTQERINTMPPKLAEFLNNMTIRKSPNQ